MTRRTILIDARLPWGSGIGRYVRNIVPSVAAHLPAVDFTLLVSPADADRARAVTEGGNVTVRATTIRSFSVREQTALPSLARHYDLAWFTNYWVPLRWSGPFVATVHDLIHLEPSFPASAVRRTAAARTFAKVRRDAAHVIFDSRFSARVFEAKAGTPRAASVVHLGIDHAGTPDPPLRPGARSKTALVVAASKEHKNLPLLLDAWQEAGLDGWQLIVVTPNDDLRSSIDLAGRAERIASVRLLRGISDAELDRHYASAGFVLVPSRYEGFGLPLLEAMRAGAPVVSSTAESLVEVASGASLPFVNPSDHEGWVAALRAMAAECGPSNEWQQAVTERNRVVARSFTWQGAGTRTAAILRQTLAAASPSAQ